jgi:hypothetical protein
MEYIQILEHPLDNKCHVDFFLQDKVGAKRQPVPNIDKFKTNPRVLANR